MYLPAVQRLPPPLARLWALPLRARVLLVLIHLRTNLTTRALAALCDTRQFAVDPPDNSNHPSTIDGTLIPVHDQSITAISNYYRRSVNTQVIICSHRRSVVVAGQCWPANRNDVIVARHTVAHFVRWLRHPR